MIKASDRDAVFLGCAIGGHAPAGATNRAKLADGAVFVDATACPSSGEADLWEEAETAARRVLAFESAAPAAE